MIIDMFRNLKALTTDKKLFSLSLIIFMANPTPSANPRNEPNIIPVFTQSANLVNWLNVPEFFFIILLNNKIYTYKDNSSDFNKDYH